jgi:hypothetical protein
MKDKIDITDVGFVTSFIIALIGDFAFILALGLFIPAVGLVFGTAFLFAHYFCGIVMGAFLFHKARGWLAKLVLVLAIVLPLPLLTIGIVLGILLSNKFLAFVAKQAIIQGVAALTAGAGEALEVGAATEAGAEGVAATAEGAGALAEGAGATAEATAETGEETGEIGKGAKAVEESAREKELESSMETEAEKEPIEELGKKTFEGPPEEPEGAEPPEQSEEEVPKEKPAQKVRDIIEKLDRRDQSEQQEGDKEGEDEEKAA